MQTEIDRDALRTLYNQNETAQFILDTFAERQRGARETKVDSLLDTIRRRGRQIRRGEIFDFFRQLEEIGCGELKHGRKGHASRFEWSINLTAVGRLATGEDTNLSADEDDSDTDMVPHKFLLRADLEVELMLPLDLTAHEAQRLAGYIQALPLENA